MTRNRSIMAILAMTAMGATACARPSAKADPGRGLAPDSPFCHAVLDYRQHGQALNGGSALAADPKAAQQQISLAHQQLVSMIAQAKDAPQVQADLRVVANTFAAIDLSTVPPNDLTAYTAAVNKALQPDPKKINDASGRLDLYIASQCGLTTSPNLTTTTTGPTTTVGPTTTATGSGPVGPSVPPASSTTASSGVTSTTTR